MKKRLLLFCLVISLSGCASFLVNTKMVNTLQSGKIYIGMTKQDLIVKLGYPPEGKSKPDMFFSSAVSRKTTGDGIEELWSYDVGVAPDLTGVRIITFKIVNGVVKEYYEGVK